MPEIYCRICGTIAQPTDLFCRRCGSSLGSTTIAEEGTQNAKPKPGKEGSVGNEVRSSLKSIGPKRTTCLVAAAGGLLFLTLAFVVIYFIALAIQPGGRPALAIELVGTSTPYPTRTPYRTGTPYRTPTPYPTVVPYPTTGALAPVAPAIGASEQPFVPLLPHVSGGCLLIIKNQNTDVDSVILLSNVDTNAIAAAVYVRASDSFSEWGIPTGTYYTYIAVGQDWDAIAGRFKNNADYFRFKDSVVFDTCPSSRYSIAYPEFQYYEVTLNISEGSGSDTIYVPPDSFPSYSP